METRTLIQGVTDLVTEVENLRRENATLRGILEQAAARLVPKRDCTGCGLEFAPRRADQEFCTRRCMGNHKQREYRARKKAEATQ